MKTYKLYKNNNEQGLIYTTAPEDVVQNYWNQVYSNVYAFEQRRYIESVNGGVTGQQQVTELVALLARDEYIVEEPIEDAENIINIHGNQIDTYGTN